MSAPLCECGCGAETAWRWGASYSRFLPGHNRARTPIKYLICEETGCWEWQRSKNPKGYGNLTIDGERWPAHRWYYTQHVGPIPEGMQLDHLCRNPSCVNPDHLEPVTHAQNLHRGNSSKMTWELVDEIRSSVETTAALARRLRFHYNTVDAVRHHRSWQESERPVRS